MSAEADRTEIERLSAELEALKFVLVKAKEDRAKAERHAASMAEECKRREVSDFHIGQMIKLGVDTNGVIYMQALLNEYGYRVRERNEAVTALNNWKESLRKMWEIGK